MRRRGRRRAALAALLGAVCALAAACAPAWALTAVEYRAGITPHSRLGGIAAGPDGNVWFTELSGTGLTGRIGRITPAGVVTELPQANPVYAIVAGPDGKMWFSEQPASGGPRLGWITVDGASHGSFSAGGTDPSPLLLALIVGPDHAFWMTRTETDATIARMTTSGALTTFTPRYQPPSLPAGITRGPDGALWYAETGENRVPENFVDPSYRGIGRITTTGQITPFPLRKRRAGHQLFPMSITTGPDHALWFTAELSTIGRMTTSGHYTLYDAREPANRFLGSIVSGPDGNLWYTVGGGRVGRITPKGNVTIFRTPGRVVAPGALAVGADGNLWMTESSGIVKITPPSGRCIVPKLVGLRYPRATRRLHRAGCTRGRVVAPRHRHRATLTVRHQSPRRGARLPRESAVDLTLR